MSAENKNEADLILHNGRITTLDAKHPEATNIAIKGGRIAGVDDVGWCRFTGGVQGGDLADDDDGRGGAS